MGFLQFLRGQKELEVIDIEKLFHNKLFMSKCPHPANLAVIIFKTVDPLFEVDFCHQILVHFFTVLNEIDRNNGPGFFYWVALENPQVALSIPGCKYALCNSKVYVT